MNYRHIFFCLVALSLPSISHGASEWGPWKTLTTKDNVQLDFRVLDGKQYDQVQWRAVNHNAERISFSVVNKRYYTAGANQSTWEKGPDEGSDVAAGKIYGLMPDTVETNVGLVEANLEVKFLDRKARPEPSNQKPSGGSNYWGGTTQSSENTAGHTKPASETTLTTPTDKGPANTSTNTSGSSYWSGQATGGPPQSSSFGKTPGSKLGGANITRVPDGPPNGSIRPKDKAATNKASSSYWSGADGTSGATTSSSNKASSNHWSGGGSANTTPDTSKLGQNNRQIRGSIQDTQDSTNDDAAAYRRREAAEERAAANARSRAAQQENEDDNNLAARQAAYLAEQTRLANQLRELSRGNFNPPPTSQSSSNGYPGPKPLLRIATPDRSAEVDLERQQQAQAAAEARRKQEHAQRVAQIIEQERRAREAADALRPRNPSGAR